MTCFVPVQVNVAQTELVAELRSKLADQIMRTDAKEAEADAKVAAADARVAAARAQVAEQLVLLTEQGRRLAESDRNKVEVAGTTAKMASQLAEQAVMIVQQHWGNVAGERVIADQHRTISVSLASFWQMIVGTVTYSISDCAYRHLFHQ